MSNRSNRPNIFKFAYFVREWAILGAFVILTGVMLFPLSTNLSDMVPEPADPLLNVWRMQWNVRAFLGGPENITTIFNTNIFYPFPLTLAFSEHFLMIAAQALPLLVLFDSHLVGMNVSVLLTFVLSGYAMYLLLTDWTGNRWAGLVAGVLFAFSPLRFGQVNHLELLVTHWLPLTLLALHWTLTRSGKRYPILFFIFFNLQALSGFHYMLNLVIACGLLALVYAAAGRVYWRKGLWAAAAIIISATFLLNWPVWSIYLHFSDVMAAVRSPGEVRVYSAAATDYLTTLPHNLLYGWTFGRWQPEGHQFQPLMPVGITGILLAAAALATPFFKTGQSNSDAAPLKNRAGKSGSYAVPAIVFLLLLLVTAVILSFGLNENALGPALASLLKKSPYFWLYEQVLFFRGIRVPARFAILVAFSPAGLAGFGAAALYKIFRVKSATMVVVLGAGLIGLVLLESWSAPLEGPTFRAGKNIPEVYQWLARETPADTVVLELPYQDTSEFLYEYYSSYHWRRLANGGTGFTPPIYKEMRHWFDAFPDARSVDAVRQLGIDVVLLHRDMFSAEEWQQIMDDLPRYLPAIEQIHQVGDTLVLQMAPPSCGTAPEQIEVTFDAAEINGQPNAVTVAFKNRGPAAFVSDVGQVSQLLFSDDVTRNFIEPLVIPAGETQSIAVPLNDNLPVEKLHGAQLTTLERVVFVDEVPAPDASVMPPENPIWQPLSLKFADGTLLAAYHLNLAGITPCETLKVALKWEGGQSGNIVLVQLLDPFGRLVAESATYPWRDNGSDTVDMHPLPLPGSLPPGKYGLRVLLQSAGGSFQSVITDDGTAIPAEMIPPLPLIIHPWPATLPETSNDELAIFEGGIHLRGAEVETGTAAPGDWLKFSLVWQVEETPGDDLTVFTQLVGPDGQVWGQYDNQPGGGWYGMPLWQPDRLVEDNYTFQLAPDAPPGQYRLIVGLYHSDTLERLPTQAGEDFLEVGIIDVQ